MRHILPLALLALYLASGCGTEIKNRDATVEEEAGTSSTTPPVGTEASPKPLTGESKHEPLLGYWVGYFEKDETDVEKNLYVGDAFSWNRANKINLSIDQITDTLVTGHSVVAGNDRPFSGTMQQTGDHSFRFTVREPGDDRYDGEFTFTIAVLSTYSGELSGKWTAYRDIDIKHRKYTLSKRSFTYTPEVMLERAQAYVNWNRVVSETETYEDDDEFVQWVTQKFATTTDQIYEMNASLRKLTREEVENLKRGDLIVIRNTIYARHGYSFKNRPLRVFFDAQSWYIPVHTDIRADFTEIEKQNIQLLLTYEKNASEYYDSFGRG
jgi:hypothetical protein